MTFYVYIPNHRASPRPSFSVILYKAIDGFRFDLVSVTAILDLCKSRILPRVDTPTIPGFI